MPILGYPADPKSITQSFGQDNSNHEERQSWYDLFDKKHPGVDFGVPVGSVISAALDGVVVRREFHRGMGNVLGVRNGNIVLLYAHLSDFRVSLGDQVKTGQIIGLSGNTGSACGEPHLHFEIGDISKTTLKEMVFDPPFGKEIDQWTDTFIYTVNNKNTKKTWNSLASLFFGNNDSWQDIAKANPACDQDPRQTLPDKISVIIPNFL